MRRGVVLLIALAAGIGVAVLAGASPGATCTAAQKAQRQAAVTAYRKKIPAERAAYFRTHKTAKLRAAFVKRQQARLKALQTAAACTVPAPPTTAPGPTTLPIPTDEPGFSPSLARPPWADQRFSGSPNLGEWGPKSDPYFLPGAGTLHGLLIMVDFPGTPEDKPVTFYENYLEPPSEDYYRDNSYGKLNLDLQTFPRWMHMSKPIADYGLQGGGNKIDLLRAFVAEATALVDGEVDFAGVDAVWVLGPEGAVQATSGFQLYRTWPGEGVFRDGKELRWGVVGGAGLDPRGPSKNLTAHHFITHELGHLLGLPDLYDAANRDGGAAQFAWAGRWDIMADNRASSHMFTWHKWLLGWLDPRQLRGLTAPGSTEATLTPLEIPGGFKAVMVPISPSVLYVVEDRQPIGEDSELCDKGVLVWIVDSSKQNVDHNAVVQAAGRSYNDACGAIFDAGWKSGAFEDGQVKVEVLEALTNGNYRVRVTRK